MRRQNRSNSSRGFTLIELLIVVAIIAILAAIAVPNFLEAQTRAKVSRVKSDLRTFNTAVEAYRVDHNKYVISLDQNGNWNYAAAIALRPLSTPVAYITSSRFRDPFKSAYRALPGWNIELGDDFLWAYYKWTSASKIPALTFGDNWGQIKDIDACCIWSMGPGSAPTTPEWSLANFVGFYPSGVPDRPTAYRQLYDPTNGTNSVGGIIRYMGDTRGFNPHS